MVTTAALVVSSLSVALFLFVPVVQPCEASGCVAQEDLYIVCIAIGFWLSLAGTILSSFAVKGVRWLLILASLLLLGVWFVVASAWSG